MFGFMVTADGGLTTAGYVITVIAGIILFFLAIYFAIRTIKSILQRVTLPPHGSLKIFR